MTATRRRRPSCMLVMVQIPSSSEVQPDGDGAGVPLQPFGPTERDSGRTQHPESFRAAFQDRGPLDEVEHAQARRETGGTGGREDVVGTADIVSDRLGRMAAEENRPGVADLRRKFVSIRGFDLQM